MKFSLKTVILGFLLISFHIIQIQTQEESEIKNDTESLRDYKEKEFENLISYLKKYNISEEIATPMKVEVNAHDELVVVAKEDIPVNLKI